MLKGRRLTVYIRLERHDGAAACLLPALWHGRQGIRPLWVCREYKGRRRFSSMSLWLRYGRILEVIYSAAELQWSVRRFGTTMMVNI
jgi:hypothetical protein